MFFKWVLPHTNSRVRFFFASGSFLHPPTFMNPFCRRMARSSAERIVILSHWKEPGTSGTETRQSCRTSFHHGGFHLPFPHFRLFRHTHPHRAVLSPFPHDIYLPTTTRLLTQRFHHHSSHIVPITATSLFLVNWQQNASSCCSPDSWCGSLALTGQDTQKRNAPRSL